MHDLLVPLAHLLISGLSVFLVAKLMPGFDTKSYTSAVFFALVAGVLNALAWHYFRPVSIAFSVVTFGIGVFVINGILFLIAGKITGVRISGRFTAALASVAVMVMNWVMHLVFGRWAP